MKQLNFSELVTKANSDAEFRHAARYWDGQIRFAIGDLSVTIRLVDGHARLANGDTHLGVHDIKISAAEHDWEKLLSRKPPPGWHDVYNAKTFTISANELDLGPYYAAIRRIIALLSEQLHGEAAQAIASPSTLEHEDAVGRYVWIWVHDIQYRVYYEETGDGIPLVLLHTAGADGRQYRHLLAHRGIQERYRQIAVDLPYHGKSLPPTGTRWWQEEYILTRDFLLDFFDSFCQALKLERPVFMGCSVGGLLAPDLAFYRPNKYRAVIALNSALALPSTHLASEAKVRSWYHPRISSEWKESGMMGFMSPTSPEVFRRETAWVYGQGSPRVFAGDVYYYMQDHTLTAEQASKIDTDATGVYLLTGEYDPLAVSGHSQQLASAIPGAYFEIHDGLGHFGPSENPQAFIEALLPVLDHIATRSLGDKGQV